MKAGLQQIPIQGAAPRLAGNREWDGLPMPTRFWAILAVAFGVSLSVIDGAIANVALPTMARMLGISSANSIWIVNAYQLAIVVSLLSFSALGDVIGYRKIYIGGLGIFIVASLGCTLSDSLATLVTARVCQGFGAAAITSVNTTLIRLIYPRRHLGRGMGVNATVVAVSSVAGPTLASGILSIATWPWLFAINIPIGLIACLLSYRFLPKNPVRIRGRHFDWRDGLMNALTFGLLIASIEGYSHGLKPSYIGISVILLVLIGTLFVRSQLHKPYPILPFDLLRIPIFSVSVITSICSFIAQMLAMVALPFYLQKTFGYTEVHTGLILTAWPAIIMVVAPIAGLLVERIHAGAMGGVGLLIMAAGVVLLAFSARATPRRRHRLATPALRPRIRPVPISQQQHPDRLRTARAKRKRQRYAGNSPAHGTDDRSGSGSPAVPYRPGKRLPYRPVACRRVCPGRFRRQLLTAIARPAAGPYPKQGKSLNPASDTLFCGSSPPFSLYPKERKDNATGIARARQQNPEVCYERTHKYHRFPEHPGTRTTLTKISRPIKSPLITKKKQAYCIIPDYLHQTARSENPPATVYPESRIHFQTASEKRS